MRISLLTIGNELLRGKTINTNAAFLGESLQPLGLEIQQCVTVPDRPEAIRTALDWLLPQSDVVITGGGLGSTGDDLTRDTVAAYLQLPLIVHADAEARIKAYLDIRGEQCAHPEKVMRQALVPTSAEILPNDAGTAPGLWLSVPGTDKHIAMLPGPPSEIRPMVSRYLLPRLAALGGEKIFTRLYDVAGASELEVEQKVRELLDGETRIELAYCAEYDHVRLFLSGRDVALVDAVAERVAAAFGARLLRPGCTSMPEEMVQLLRERGWFLATAESCTGGLIAASITDIAGSSEVFSGSIVSYSNRIKQEQLDVPEAILREYGAVSAECVTAMVTNLVRKFKTEAGIAVSGIAGPGGGTADKPVGLVFLAVKLGERLVVRRCLFSGNRDAVRRQTVSAAWLELRQLLLTAN